MSAAAKAPTAPTIELVTPPAELRDWRTRRDNPKREFFDRGERIIMVDGVRWGRTRVTWHGCHGTRTGFIQDNGEELGRTSKGGYFHREAVSSPNARHAKQFITNPATGEREYRLPDNFKSGEELVLEKVRELVATGKLRDPAVVKAESDAAHARYQKRQAEGEKREAAGYTGEPNDPESVELIDRIVAAMRWAQVR